MKKVLLTVSASVLALSLSGIASASTVPSSSDQPQSNAVDTTKESANTTITYIPLDPFVTKPGDVPSAAQPSIGGINAQRENVTLKGIGSSYVMNQGSNWLIWKGSDVVKLSGATITSIGYGDAIVYAYKGSGQLLGAYYINVIR